MWGVIGPFDFCHLTWLSRVFRSRHLINLLDKISDHSHLPVLCLFLFAVELMIFWIYFLREGLPRTVMVEWSNIAPILTMSSSGWYNVCMEPVPTAHWVVLGKPIVLETNLLLISSLWGVDMSCFKYLHTF